MDSSLAVLNSLKSISSLSAEAFVQFFTDVFTFQPIYDDLELKEMTLVQNRYKISITGTKGIGGVVMKISYLHIKNFKSIRDLELKDLENALILVGKNNTGKTVVISAILLAAGELEPQPRYFLEP